MILADLYCRACGWSTEDFVPSSGPFGVCEACGQGLSKALASAAFVVPWNMTAEGTRKPLAHEEWVKSPEVQAKLKSGEYEIQSGKGLV